MCSQAPDSRLLHPRVLVLVLQLGLGLVLLQGDLDLLLSNLPRPHVQHHRLTLDEAAQATLQALLWLLGGVRGAGLGFVLLLEEGGGWTGW